MEVYKTYENPTTILKYLNENTNVKIVRDEDFRRLKAKCRKKDYDKGDLNLASSGARLNGLSLVKR